MEGGGGSAARRHGGDARERGRGLDRGVAEEVLEGVRTGRTP